MAETKGIPVAKEETLAAEIKSKLAEVKELSVAEIKATPGLTPEEIGALKATIVIDKALQSKSTPLHTKLIGLLQDAPVAVGSLATLMSVATQYDDFHFDKMVGAMKHKSFLATLVQVTDAGCGAFVLAEDNLAIIKGHADHIPDVVKDMLEFDGEGRVEVVEHINEVTTKCADLADAVVAEFKSVTLLIQDVFQVFTGLRGQADMERMHQALTAGMKQLNEVEAKWEAISAFFKAISVLIKVDLVTCVKELRGTARNLTRLGNKAVKVCMTSVRILLLADSYMDVSDKHLRARVRTLKGYLIGARDNYEKFKQLANECEKSGEDIRIAIVSSNEKVPELLQEAVDRLKA